MSAKRITLDLDELIHLYCNGMSEKALADHYGVSRTAIRHRLIAQDIPRRGQSEAEIVKWQQMSPQKRQTQVAAAHAATLGHPVPPMRGHRIAETLQARGRMNPTEALLQHLLAARGISTCPQQAIGPYNCDLGAPPVAVECWGGEWHFSGAHARREPQRLRYFFNAGWHAIYIVISIRFPLLARATDDIAAFIEMARSRPSMRREYRMIGGTGELLACGSEDDKHFPLIPPFTCRKNPTTGRYERIPRDTHRV